MNIKLSNEESRKRINMLNIKIKYLVSDVKSDNGNENNHRSYGNLG